jgi:3'(2'), 5'-bisphosphate nucleotidase
LAARLATEAGHLLVQVRDELTRAGAPAWHVMDAGDIASHRFIAEQLATARPDDAVLSEEGFEDPRRFDADRVWLVDPLDGTSEVGEHGRHDWAVHVALWDADHFGAGAVSIPALGLIFCTDPAPVVPPFDRERPRLVTSRNRNPYVAVVIANALDADAVRLGSAGAKAMAVVTGEADIYVHDGACTNGIRRRRRTLLAAGLHVSRIDGHHGAQRSDPWLPDLLICRRIRRPASKRCATRTTVHDLAVPGDGGLIEPSLTGTSLEEPHDVASGTDGAVTTRVPGLTIAAMSSIGAGIIHAAAAGVHAEHPQLARLFILCAIAQVGAGLLAIARPVRWLALPVVAINAAAVGVWLATRITGISWIEGLEVREAPQFADTACALLAAAAVGCGLAAAMVGRRKSPTPHLMFPALAVAALTIPAMFSSGTHVHSHSHAATTGGVVDESQPHSHTADGTSVAAGDTASNPATDPSGNGSGDSAAVPVVDESSRTATPPTAPRLH